MRFVLPSPRMVASSFNPFSAANLCISVLALLHVGQTDLAEQHAYPTPQPPSPCPWRLSCIESCSLFQGNLPLGAGAQVPWGSRGGNIPSDTAQSSRAAAFPPASLYGGQGAVTVGTVLSPGARAATGDDCPGPGPGERWAETSLHSASLEVREYGSRGARIPAAGGRLGSVTHRAQLCPCCCEAAPGKPARE